MLNTPVRETTGLNAAMTSAAVSPPVSLRPDVITPRYALGTFGPVLLQLWQLATPDEGARRARILARGLRADGHTRTATLIVVPESSVMPSAEAREQLSNMPTDLPGCAGLALVREGEGFRAATVRAIMTGMMSFERRAPFKIFAGRGEACAWLAHQLGAGGCSAATLERAHEQLLWLWQRQTPTSSATQPSRPSGL